MREGWNPIYEEAVDFNKINKTLPDNIGQFGGVSQWQWPSFYPKGLAIVSANLYSLTNNIESTKYIHYIFIFIVVFLLYDYVKIYLGKGQSILLGLIAGLNPVMLQQLRSFYIDSDLNNLVMAYIILIISYFDKNDNINRKYVLVTMSIIMIISLNIKFNAILYMG